MFTSNPKNYLTNRANCPVCFGRSEFVEPGIGISEFRIVSPHVEYSNLPISFEFCEPISDDKIAHLAVIKRKTEMFRMFVQDKEFKEQMFNMLESMMITLEEYMVKAEDPEPLFLTFSEFLSDICETYRRRYLEKKRRSNETVSSDPKIEK